MFDNLPPSVLHFAITALLAVAGQPLCSRGCGSTARWHLLVSALLLGLANAVIKPLIVALTFPLTMLSFGLFLLVINALMLWLVAKLVSGFRLDGFGTAFWASIFISLLSLLLGGFVLEGSPEYTIPTGPDAVWL
jgi:putative membrane protein